MVLTLAVEALVAFRLLLAPLGVWSLLIGILASRVLWQLASMRGRRTQVALVVAPGPLPGGALLLGIAAVAVIVAAFGLFGVVITR